MISVFYKCFMFQYVVCVLFLNTHPRIYISDFIERGREREESIDVRKKHRLVVPPLCTPTRDQICNAGVFPELESNSPPFGIWD